MTETYSKSVDFNNQLNISQLQSEIIAETSITTTLLRIDILGDAVYIVFNSTINGAEKTLLNTLVNNHTPIIPDDLAELRTDQNGRVYRQSGIDKIYQFHNYTNEIIIDINGRGQYTTIKDAIDNNTSPGTIYRVMPGTYIENNPITIPAECLLSGHGTSKQATIVAANPNSDLIYINEWSKIDSFFLVGAHGTGSRAVYFDGTGIAGYALVEECIIIDCDIGLETVGYPGVMISNRTMVTVDPTKGRAPSAGVYCHSSGQFTGWSMAIQGYQTPYLPITEGIKCENIGSKLSMSTSNVYLATDGAVVDDDGELELNLLTARGNMNGLKVKNTNTNSKVRANSFNILDSIVSDLNIEANDADLSLFSAELNESKINNPNNIKLSSRAYFNENGKKYQVIAGDIRVGGRNQKSSLSIGEGKYDDSTTKVFTNDNLEIGTWIDNTSAAITLDPPNFNMFQTINVGNCMYIGRDSPLVGCKLNITTKTISDVTKDDLVWEYWNGTNWTQMCTMNTMANSPYYYRDLSVVSYQEKQHIRFNITCNGGNMTLKTLNGSELYWVRLRVVNILSSIPVSQYVHTHVSESKFNSEGFLEHFGNARPVKRLPWTLGDTEPANSSPNNQDLYISDKLGVELKENKFINNTVDRLGMNIFLPQDLDISFPIKIKFAIVGSTSTSGNVQLVCRWNTTNSGSSVYYSTASAPSSSIGENSVNTIINDINTANTEYRGELVVDLSRVNPCPEGTTPQLLTMTIERDATSNNTNDTYPGDIAFYQLTPFYVAWRSGGYLESF
jgi:hypothetical protein